MTTHREARREKLEQAAADRLALSAVRTVKLAPDMDRSPPFYLTVWETRRHGQSECSLEYRLRSDRQVVCEGAGFRPPALAPLGSDQVIRALLSFLGSKHEGIDRLAADFTAQCDAKNLLEGRGLAKAAFGERLRRARIEKLRQERMRELGSGAEPCR